LRRKEERRVYKKQKRKKGKIVVASRKTKRTIATCFVHKGRNEIEKEKEKVKILSPKTRCHGRKREKKKRKKGAEKVADAQEKREGTALKKKGKKHWYRLIQREGGKNGKGTAATFRLHLRPGKKEGGKKKRKERLAGKRERPAPPRVHEREGKKAFSVVVRKKEGGWTQKKKGHEFYLSVAREKGEAIF